MNKTIPLKTLVLSSLVAVLLVMLQPSTFLTSTVLCVTPIAIAALYAWAGTLPAAILSGGTVFILGAFAANALKIPSTVPINPVWAVLGALVVLVLPAAVSIAVMEKKLPFFERMAITIAAQMSTLLLCVAVIYLGLKMDLVNVMTDSMSILADELGIEVKLSMLQTFGSMGMLTKESAEGVNAILKQISQIDLMQSFMGYSLAEQQLQTIESALTQAFEYINYYMKQVMPAMLVHSGMISGILLTFVPSWIVSARAQKAVRDTENVSFWEKISTDKTPLEESEESLDEEAGFKESKQESILEHLPLVQWQVSRHAMGMLLVGLITGLVLQTMQMNSATAVTAVFSLLLTTLLTIQGLAAAGRFMLKIGTPHTSRRVIMIILMIFATPGLEMLGTASALFGSQGVYTLWIKKRIEENGKDDDEE